MFKDNRGNLSSTKILAFIGYLAFIVVSIAILFLAPDKFDYRIFAILSAGSASSVRLVDKYLNVLQEQKK